MKQQGLFTTKETRAGDILDDKQLHARLPLYEPAKIFTEGVEHVVGVERDPSCQLCELGVSAKHPCLVGATGGDGSPLLVLESPTQHDDIGGYLVPQGSGALLLKALEKAWQAPVRVVYALGCPSGRDATMSMIQSCRAYLAAEYAKKPPRVVLCGPVAVQSVFGVAFNPGRTRKAWAMVRGVPTFLVMALGQAIYNRILRKQFESDMIWALQTPTPEAVTGTVEVALTAGRALQLLAEIRDGVDLVVDVEHTPKSPFAAGVFRMLCVGFCQDEERPFVLPEEVLKDKTVLAVMKGILENPRVPKVNQHIQHDRHALWRAFGIEIVGIEADTLLLSRLMESDAPAGLAQTVWRIGMGGYKDVGQQEAEDD